MREKTKTWYESARGDLEFAESILRNNQRPCYAVHFCHQAIEKMLKAIVQEFTEEVPKRTHNLKILCEQSDLILSHDHKEFLARLAPHYLASKYPEDIKRFNETYTKSYGQNIFDKTSELFTWLEKRLRSKG